MEVEEVAEKLVRVTAGGYLLELCHLLERSIEREEGEFFLNGELLSPGQLVGRGHHGAVLEVLHGVQVVLDEEVLLVRVRPECKVHEFLALPEGEDDVVEADLFDETILDVQEKVFQVSELPEPLREQLRSLVLEAVLRKNETQTVELGLEIEEFLENLHGGVSQLVPLEIETQNFQGAQTLKPLDD